MPPAARSAPTAEELVSAVAAEYSPELVDSAVRRLHSYQGGSGRRCERCMERKPLTGFSRDARDKSGLRRYCRECQAKSNREAYARRIQA
jgi:hypothetical protein